MDWSDLSRVLSEMFARLWVATTQKHDRPEVQNRFNTFLDEVQTQWLASEPGVETKAIR